MPPCCSPGRIATTGACWRCSSKEITLAAIGHRRIIAALKFRMHAPAPGSGFAGTNAPAADKQKELVAWLAVVLRVSTFPAHSLRP